MADLTSIVLLLILVLDFVISLWNAYASGLVWTLLRNQHGQTFAKACAIAGLGLAFAGMAYVMLIAVGWLALLLGVIFVSDFVFLVSFDFLVFGAMIIGFGLVVTAQSIAIAYRQRNFGAIAVSAWNVFAEVWDIAIYAEGFNDAAGVVKGQRGRSNIYALVAIALSFAFLLTFVAYRQGVRKAEGAIEQSPSQTAAEDSARGRPSAARPHHLRATILVGLVVLIVVIASIAVIALTASSNKVKVSEIDVWAPDNVCGLGNRPVSYAGFSDAPGTIDAFSFQIPNFNSTTCTLNSVTTNTSGFGLSNAVLPVTVAAAKSGTLSVSVILPNSGFNGILNLVYR